MARTRSDRGTQAAEALRRVAALLRGWRVPDAAERYLAAATDHADLERRMRALERLDAGPAFVTFNH